MPDFSQIKEFLNKDSTVSTNALRNYLNLQRREETIPRVSADEQQLTKEDQIARLFHEAGLGDALKEKGTGIPIPDFSASSTYVAKDVASRPKSYFEERIIPDVLNNIAGFVQSAEIGGVRPGAPFISRPRVMFGPGMSMSVQEISQVQEAAGLVDVAKEIVSDPIEFVKNQPVTAAMMVLPALAMIPKVASVIGRVGVNRTIAKTIPKNAQAFIMRDAQAVIDGQAAYADVLVERSQYADLGKQVRDIGKIAKSRGRIVQQSRTPEGVRIAIYDPKQMDALISRAGFRKKSRAFVQDILKDPSLEQTEKISHDVMKPGRGKGWVDPGRSADLNFGDFFRSPHLVLQRLHPAGAEIFRALQNTVVENRMRSTALREVRDNFYKPIKKKYGKEYFTETLIDLSEQAKKAGDSFDLNKALEPLPDDVQQAVRAHTELMQSMKGMYIDEAIAGGVPPEIAADFGISEPYITRLFKGNYRVHSKSPSGVWEQHRATTESEAWGWKRRLAKAGHTEIRSDFDHIAPPEVIARLPRRQVKALINLMSENSGMSAEDIAGLLKKTTRSGDGEVTALASKEGRGRFARFKQRRLEDEFMGKEYDWWAGAEKNYERVTDAYIEGTSRYLALNKGKRQFNLLQDRIPHTMRALKAYTEDLMGAVEGRRFAGSVAFDGWLQKGVEQLNGVLSKANIPIGVKPYAMERWVGRALSFTAQAKLGTPRAAVVNLTQTFQTVYPRVGEKIFAQAWAESFTKEGIAAARDAGIVGIPTKFEGIKVGRGGSTPKNLLYAFSKAEEQNRTVSYLAGRRWAKSPAGQKFAKEILRLDPNDPEFIHKVGVDMVGTTQFDLSMADMAKVFRMGGPITKLMTQFKPFQFKYIEHLAQLRKHPDPIKAYGRATVGTLLSGGTRAAMIPLSPIKLARYYGMYEAYKEIRDNYGETAADVFASGLPGALHTDLSYSLNVDIFPSFGNTVEEKLVSYFAGPSLSSIVDAAKLAGVSDPEYDDFVATARRLFPQIKMGQNFAALLRNDKFLRDTRGRKVARATGPRIMDRPADLWLESLSFMTTRRRVAYEGKYDISEDPIIPINMTQTGNRERIQKKLERSFNRFSKER